MTAKPKTACPHAENRWDSYHLTPVYIREKYSKPVEGHGYTYNRSAQRWLKVGTWCKTCKALAGEPRVFRTNWHDRGAQQKTMPAPPAPVVTKKIRKTKVAKK